MVEQLGKFAVAIAAIIIGTVLLSGEAKVNLNHHHNLPSVTDLMKGQAFAVQQNGNDYHVYLDSSIVAIEKYHQLVHLLTVAKHEQTVYIHLAGNGGRVDTMMYITNAMIGSRANVVAVVEGQVHSAHAFIAFAAKEIQIAPNTLFMFHRLADADGHMGADICVHRAGKTDRGQSSELKCTLTIIAIETVMQNYLVQRLFPYLTSDEIKRYSEGHDVIILGSDMSNRLKGVQ